MNGDSIRHDDPPDNPFRRRRASATRVLPDPVPSPVVNPFRIPKRYRSGNPYAGHRAPCAAADLEEIHAMRRALPPLEEAVGRLRGLVAAGRAWPEEGERLLQGGRDLLAEFDQRLAEHEAAR